MLCYLGTNPEDRSERVVTKGLVAGQERPTVDVTVEQDNNSKQSLETSREPVNGELSKEEKMHRLLIPISLLFQNGSVLLYYGLGFVGLILTGPLPS